MRCQPHRPRRRTPAGRRTAISTHPPRPAARHDRRPGRPPHHATDWLRAISPQGPPAPPPPSPLSGGKGARALPVTPSSHSGRNEGGGAIWLVGFWALRKRESGSAGIRAADFLKIEIAPDIDGVFIGSLVGNRLRWWEQTDKGGDHETSCLPICACMDPRSR